MAARIGMAEVPGYWSGFRGRRCPTKPPPPAPLRKAQGRRESEQNSRKTGLLGFWEFDSLYTLYYGLFDTKPRDIPLQKQAERSCDASPSSIRLPALSQAAAAFVLQHPAQARLAVTAALEAAAAQFDALNRNAAEIPEAGRPYVVEPSTAIPLVGVISVEEAAQRLGVTRATVYNWIEAKRLIGWRLTRQGTFIPQEQIVGQGELVAGIEQVLELIPEPRAAWRFLDAQSELSDVALRPIDALKAGKLTQVLIAARASGETFT